MFKSCSHVHISLPSILFVDPIKKYFNNRISISIAEKGSKRDSNQKLIFMLNGDHAQNNQVRIKNTIRPLLRLIALLYFLREKNIPHKKSGHINKNIDSIEEKQALSIGKQIFN